MEQDEDKPITLRIYRLPGGRWGGRLFTGEDDIGELGAFQSTQEVEKAAAETGLYPELIEFDDPEGRGA
ncbi:hypothetical protein PQR08_11450 [Caballeronia jiangsuensis]|uniref:DUF2188 domain-containing protein n=1 Tax=Caballeronia jiangsuensis TaxID=1458357 RepID=A0ABW9CJ11_9BURK